MKTIIHVVHIHASPSQVYDALTTAEGISQWWTTRVAVDAGTGGIIRFTFHDDFHPQMQQTAIEPNRRVQWTCIAGYPPWQDSTVSFTLEDRQGETLLRFVQEYAQELSDEIYGTYNFTWGYDLYSLQLLCETRTGTPFVPPSD